MPQVRFNIQVGAGTRGGTPPPKPGTLSVGRVTMKAAVTVSLPPLLDPHVTERKVRVKRAGGDAKEISLKPDDSQAELVQPLNSPELTVTLVDVNPAGESPESDAVTVKFDGSEFAPPKPGTLRSAAPRPAADGVPNVPEFDSPTPDPEPAPAPTPADGGGDLPPDAFPPGGSDPTPVVPEPTPVPSPEGPTPDVPAPDVPMPDFPAPPAS